MLGLLATHSIVTCNQITGQDGLTQRSYGLALLGKYFLQNEDGVPFSPLLLLHLEKHHSFELLTDDDDMSKYYYRTMSVYTSLILNQVLGTYKGFEGASQVVDAGALCRSYFHEGDKERTKQELETLAKQAGFSSLKIIRHACNHCVMEI
ncbi:caffeic acid 3-O-methyltransferase-like [Gossypium australe]|uniref:Caffeic acid 3-O-methyltransferase-like n=1 Tax=Gossypium australe TaxID=47621 RepID=A0A5B6VHV7_9ROSI|nr:caffeic acid 3-O-methyltransferase-like [Gossypium australe]